LGDIPWKWNWTPKDDLRPVRTVSVGGNPTFAAHATAASRESMPESTSTITPPQIPMFISGYSLHHCRTIPSSLLAPAQPLRTKRANGRFVRGTRGRTLNPLRTASIAESNKAPTTSLLTSFFSTSSLRVADGDKSLLRKHFHHAADSSGRGVAGMSLTVSSV